MSKEIENIKENIMGQIHDEKIKMKPKIYFIIGSALTFFGLILSVMFSVFLVGLTRFYFRARGPMADYRIDRMLSNFPWWVLVLAVISLIFGIWLLRKYDFSFKVNFKMLIVGFILAVVVAGWAIDTIGLNDMMMRRGPMQGIMRRYIQ